MPGWGPDERPACRDCWHPNLNPACCWVCTRPPHEGAEVSSEGSNTKVAVAIQVDLTCAGGRPLERSVYGGTIILDLTDKSNVISFMKALENHIKRAMLMLSIEG